MAEIYGFPESEKELLDICPSEIEKFEDIDKIHKEKGQQLEKEKTEFNDKLPDKIKEQEDELNQIKSDNNKQKQQIDKKIKETKNSIEENKKNKKYFSVVSGYVNIFTQKYISKPLKTAKLKIAEENQKDKLNQWKRNPEDFFNEEQEELINKVEELANTKKSPYYPGAYGELRVLEELSKLDDSYSILCGVNIELEKWHRHDGQFNLKSAQMDFVVVSTKGIYIIEVKNWSSDYYDQNYNISPHEQIERAGKVMYIHLKETIDGDVSIKGKITKIIIPIKNNIPYDYNHKYVFISSIDRINQFINNHPDTLDESEVDQIVEELEQFVTYK